MKVKELAVERLAYGWGPEELHFQHPYLTLGQIHAALAYYWDNAQAFDREIAAELEAADRGREAPAAAALAARLKARKTR